MMTKKIILLLGMPGSGKGTQGAELSKILSIPHLSTGDIFRKMIDEDSDEAKFLKDYMLSGKLVPSELVNKIVSDYISGARECVNGCILDGYPRTMDQSDYFINHISEDVIVIFFDISDDLVIKRITGRYSCKNCGKLYNKFFSEPKISGICDDCGHDQFVFRQDDNEDTIKTRISAYTADTLPLVTYYKNRSRFFSVNASLEKAEITREIVKIIKSI
jgi:adenylate kinase